MSIDRDAGATPPARMGRAWPAAVGQAVLPAQRWWRGLAARERRGLVWAGAVLALFLVWAIALQPALRTLQRTALERDQLELQWQAMQRLAAEAQSLRGAALPSPEQAAAALQAATERLAEQGRLSVQGERAVLTLDNASPGQLRDWLAEARSSARARPVEATLSRAPGGGLSGTLVVAIGGGL